MRWSQRPLKTLCKEPPFLRPFFLHVGSSETAHQIWSLWRQYASSEHSWNGLRRDHFIVSKETKFGARFHLSQRGRKNGRKKGGSLQGVFNGLWDHLMGFYVCECGLRRWNFPGKKALTVLRRPHSGSYGRETAVWQYVSKHSMSVNTAYLLAAPKAQI